MAQSWILGVLFRLFPEHTESNIIIFPFFTAENVPIDERARSLHHDSACPHSTPDTPLQCLSSAV